MAWNHLIAGSLLGLCSVLHAANPDGTTARPLAMVLPQQVAAFAADLSSDARATRTQAEAGLIALGPAALEHLPHADSARDPQTRDSLRRIARTLEAADAAIALESQTVYVAEQSTRRKWIDALASQTGNQFRLDQVSPHWLDAGTKPPGVDPISFWEVIRWLEADQQVTAAMGREVQLLPRDSQQPSAKVLAEQHRGVFRLQCLECQSRPLPQGGHLIRTRVGVCGEPRLRPLFLVSGVDQWKVAAKQVDYAPYTPGARREFPGGMGAIEVSWDFVVPAGAPVPDTVTIDGELALTLAARTSRIDFRDLQGPFPITRRRGQSSVSVLGVKSDVTQSSIRLAVALGGRDGLFESYRAALMTPDLKLEPTPGHTLGPVDINQIQEAPEGVVLECQFPAEISAGASLQAQVPTVIATEKIAFWFEQVPVMPAP